MDTNKPADGVPSYSLIVDKYATYIPVSNEQLMDCGIIPDTRPKPSKWQTFKWRVRELPWRARVRLASWIVGYDIENIDE
jgi:hypothetical protein